MYREGNKEEGTDERRGQCRRREKRWHTRRQGAEMRGGRKEQKTRRGGEVIRVKDRGGEEE